jgi:hypothetical protein
MLAQGDALGLWPFGGVMVGGQEDGASRGADIRFTSRTSFAVRFHSQGCALG